LLAFFRQRRRNEARAAFVAGWLYGIASVNVLSGRLSEASNLMLKAAIALEPFSKAEVDWIVSTGPQELKRLGLTPEDDEWLWR